MELAGKLHAGLELPPRPAGHVGRDAWVHDGVPSAFPNGCHVAEVEIDPETGACHVRVRYTAG